MTFFNKIKQILFTSGSLQRIKPTVTGFGTINPVWLTSSNVALLSIYTGITEINSMVDEIAELASSIELGLYKKNNKGDEIEITDHWVLDSLKMPNPIQDGKLFRKTNAIFYLTLGNSFINKVDANLPKAINKVELWVLPAQYLQIVTEDPFDSVDYRLNKINRYELNTGCKLTFSPDEIIHIKDVNVNFDNGQYLLGYGNLALSIKSNTSLSSIHDAIVSMFQKRGALGIISSKDSQFPLSGDEAKALKQKYFEEYGLHANKSSILITTGNVEYTQMAMDLMQLQSLENKKDAIIAIANRYRYPLPLIFNDAATYNNMDTARKYLYTNAVIPLLKTECAAYNKGFNLEKEGLYFRPKLESISELKEDEMQKEILLQGRLDRGIISIPEYRKAIGL